MEIAELKYWEELKSRSNDVGLKLVIHSVITVEDFESEVVYFQAKNLREVGIYISGYERAYKAHKPVTQK